MCRNIIIVSLLIFFWVEMCFVSWGYMFSILGHKNNDHRIVGYTYGQNFTCLEYTTVFFDDVESGNIGWNTSGYWHITDSKYHSYNHSWYASGDYDNTNWVLVSPTIDLSDYRSALIQFYSRGGGIGGKDRGYIEISIDNGQTWATLGEITGSVDWEEHTYALDSSSISSQFKIRFRLSFGENINYVCWWIDDILVNASTQELTTTTEESTESSIGTTTSHPTSVTTPQTTLTEVPLWMVAILVAIATVAIVIIMLKIKLRK